LVLLNALWDVLLTFVSSQFGWADFQRDKASKKTSAYTDFNLILSWQVWKMTGSPVALFSGEEV
jgi:hypothetical protein